MLDKLKADFDDILALVNKAPAPLQETALKTILEQWFKEQVPQKVDQQAGGGGGGGVAPGVVPDTIKPFLTANAITVEILEKVFHPTGPGAQLLASSLPGNSKSGKMISLSLLLCVKQALESGSFGCTLKELREMAVHYDCYDSANFAAVLKTNKNFYRPRQKGEDLQLSGSGQKKAGDIIKGLAAGE
jgi:hypothetical protein